MSAFERMQTNYDEQLQADYWDDDCGDELRTWTTASDGTRATGWGLRNEVVLQEMRNPGRSGRKGLNHQAGHGNDLPGLLEQGVVGG